MGASVFANLNTLEVIVNPSNDTTGATPIHAITEYCAEFHGTSITISERDGQKWMTAEQVGRALGYEEGATRKSVVNLYNRHTDEFTDAETCVIKLMTQGQMRDTRIFSATGSVKLGFFANTRRAKKFRTWASDVLAGQPAPALPAPDASTELIAKIWATVDDLHLRLDERDSQIVRLLADQQQILLTHAHQVNRLSRKVITTQSQLIRTQKHVTTLVEGRMDGAQASETIVQMHRDGHSNAQIVAATGRNHNHVRQKLWQARRDGVLPPLDAPVSPQTGLFAEGV